MKETNRTIKVSEHIRLELRSGSGHIVYKDYITALDKYLIPFFGSYDVANINAKALVDFGKWRTEQLGRKAHHSTINTHNTALNRVLDEAEQHIDLHIYIHTAKFRKIIYK